MKRYVIMCMFFILAVTCFFGRKIDAREYTQEEIDQINNMPSVEMTELKIQKNDYKLGEMVEGSFLIRNEREYGIPQLKTIITLGTMDKDGRIENVMDVRKGHDIDLASLEKKEVSFSYELPKSLIGQVFVIRVSVINDIGMPLSWREQVITANGLAEQEYTIQRAFIKVGDKSMSLQEGLIVKKDRPTHMVMDIVNPYSDMRRVVLRSTIFKNGIGGDLVNEHTDEVELHPGLNENISFVIDVDGDAPGIYDGVMILQNDTHAQVSPLVPYHYIVEGPMVTIHHVDYEGFDVNNFSLNSGDDFAVVMNYTGEIYDVIENTKPHDTSVHTTITLNNEHGESIGQWVGNINYNDGMSRVFEFSAQKDASVMHVDIVIADENNVEIARYQDVLQSKNFNDDVLSKSADFFTRNKYVMMLIIAIVPFMIVGMWFLRKKYFAVFLLFFVCGIGGYSCDVHARNAKLVSGYTAFGMSHNLVVNSPTAEVCAGEAFYIEGSHKKWSCSNANSKTVFTINYQGAKYVQDSGWQWLANKYVDIDFSIGNKGEKFIAPSIPGVYEIKFTTQDWARSWDPGDAGNNVYKISFEVINCKEDGGCNSNATGDYAWDATGFREALCKTGTPTIDPIGSFPTYGNTVTWGCVGSGGGTNTASTACSARRLSPPNCACSTNAHTDYPHTAIQPVTPLCNVGSPDPANIAFPVGQYGESSKVSWTCTNKASTPCSDTSGVCIAGRGCPTISCGTANSNVSTDTMPSSELCVSPASVSGSPAVVLGNDGYWRWNCAYASVGNCPTSVECSVPSCLTNNPLTVQPSVYWPSEGNPQASVTVNCPNVCCIFKDTDVKDDPDEVVCQGESDKYIEIDSSRSYPAECYYKDDPTHTVTVNPTVQTMCTARSCNSQGTCQATPTPSNSKDGCTSTCNSDADCSRGRMIETRP